MSTLASAPLYTAAGFEPVEELEDASGGAPVPLIRIEKTIARHDHKTGSARATGIDGR
jgi:hypothetical protein